MMFFCRLRKTAAAVLAAFACFAAACMGHTVNIVITNKDGTQINGSVALTPRKVKNSFRMKMSKSEIPANASYIDFRLDSAGAMKGDDGYFVLGDGRRGFFRADEGLLIERRNPMPIFGMKTPTGTFVAVVKKMKYEFSIVVEVVNGVYSVYPRFHVDRESLGCNPYENIVIDFYFLEGKDADYSGMGRIYRKYQLDRGEVIPLKERAKNNPQLAYSADTMFVRVKHGIKNNSQGIADQTPENEPKVNTYVSFEQFKDIMRRLKEAGVERVEMCSVGFNSGGFDGRFPDIFPIEPAFGGEKKLREAIDYAHSIDYQIVGHVVNTDFYTIAKRYNAEDIARKPDGTLLTGAILAGGRINYPCFRQVLEKYIDDDYTRLAALGFKGNHHIDVTSCIVPYICCHPDHPCNRKQTADYMNKVGLAARKYFGGWGSEGPCDHVANSIDYILYASAYPKWVGRSHELVDDVVPLWQIVYHGIILSNPFYYTIDYNIAQPRHFTPYNYVMEIAPRRLKLVEFGGRPTYYFIAYNDDAVRKIAEAYHEYQPLKYLQYEFMQSHREIAPQVFLTTYSDGSETVCNYSKKSFTYKHRDVPSMDYVLFSSKQ